MAQAGGDGEFNTVGAASRSCGDNNVDKVGGKQTVIEAAADNPASTSVVRRARRGGRRALAGDKQQYQNEQMHIWTERERRKKMKDMFTNLHALLPHLPPKADKSSIVDEAVNYIETLKYKIQLLRQKVGKQGGRKAVDSSETGREAILVDRHKVNSGSAAAAELVVVSAHGVSSGVVPETLPMPTCFQTWSSPNVVLSVAGTNGHISICGAKCPGVLSSIFQVLEDHKLEVVTAQCCSDQLRFICVIHVITNEGPDRRLDAAAVEELYKSAAGDIIQRVSP